MQRQLKMRLRGGSTWDELAAEEWLPRFVRALEAGRRRAPRWQLRALDEDEGVVGWEAMSERHDRTHRLTLSTEAAADLAAAEWTFTVESGERAPVTLRGGEWWVGAALALVGYLVARHRLGVAAALASALALLGACVILPHLFLRSQPPPSDEPDPVDEELLDRVLRGAVGFSGFELSTPDWRPLD